MQIKVYTINVKLPRWLRRTLVLGVVPAAVLGICAIVYATAVTGQPDFVAGTPLTASSMNAHLGALQTQIDTANGKLATALVPDANGNVGIGTTSPAARLHVSAGSVPGAINGYTKLLVESREHTVITVKSPSDKIGQIVFADPEHPYPGYITYDHATNSMALSANENERVRITSSGNVGIGTTSPQSILHVIATGSSYDLDVNPFPGIRIQSAMASDGAGINIAGKVNHENIIGRDPITDDLVFKVDFGGAGETTSEKVRIKGNGNVGIGTASPQYALDVTGTIRGDNVTPSDRSLKKNIEPLPADTLGRVCKISGVSFKWDVDGYPKTPQIGLIAQDVEKVFPSLVETDSMGVKSIHYMGVTAVLLEAVKSQQKQVEELKARVRALEEPRAGARAAHARPAQQPSRRATIGIARLPTQAPGA